MTRQECEDKLLALAEQARDIYREFAGDDATDLHIVILGSGTIGIDDTDKAISVLKSVDTIMGRTGYWRGVLGIDRVVDA